MADLPITRMTLYKHGVGFFERRGRVSGEQITLAFRVDDMNDILKSLTVIDWGAGQVRGVAYTTPQSRAERLKGCSIQLADDRGLRDLLVGLRGRPVHLMLDQEETMSGTLVGLDEVPERQPLGTSLVSVFVDESHRVLTVPLERVRGVEIRDEQGVDDLRFFLQTALGQEEHRQVSVRLTEGEHDLSVSYIAPAPTWRVSYRLVIDPLADENERALLLGWGIFDNSLEEDLQDITLSLVAGMPISFVYDLFTPFTPERPRVEEEARVAAAPVEFEAATAGAATKAERPARLAAAMMERTLAPSPAAAPQAISRDTVAQATPVATTGTNRGERFQYTIETPVTVGRGQSAMVPIVSVNLGYRKELLYNSARMANHPVATLRMENETGLTLERGPVTVLESGEYAGEALVSFTPEGGELVVPYAVELGLKVREQSGSRRESHGLRIQGAYMVFEEWDVRWRDYQLTNGTKEERSVLVEHPRTADYEPFDTPEPEEKTERHWRFKVVVDAGSETTLRVQERRLVSRREELRRQSYAKLQRYLRQGLLERKAYDRLTRLLELWDEIEGQEHRLSELEQERQKIYQAQGQIQGSMGALSPTGKEGALRARYVEELASGADRLNGLDDQETTIKADIKRLKQEIEHLLETLS